MHHGARRSGTYGKPVVRLNLGSEDDGPASGSWRGTISILTHEAAPESNSVIIKAARKRPLSSTN